MSLCLRGGEHCVYVGREEGGGYMNSLQSKLTLKLLWFVPLPMRDPVCVAFPSEYTNISVGSYSNPGLCFALSCDSGGEGRRRKVLTSDLVPVSFSQTQKSHIQQTQGPLHLKTHTPVFIPPQTEGSWWTAVGPSAELFRNFRNVI